MPTVHECECVVSGARIKFLERRSAWHGCKVRGSKLYICGGSERCSRVDALMGGGMKRYQISSS